MKVVFISYWVINQGLTESTIISNINELLKDARISSISLITFEREPYTSPKQDSYKHIPIEEYKVIRAVSKFTSLRKCYNILKSENSDLVIARSSLASIIAFNYFKKTKMSYIVESFELHTKYMIDSEEWKKNGFKSTFLNKYENPIRQNASFLLPVSHKFADHLIKDGIDAEKIIALPCTVDHQQFAFDDKLRENIRKELNIYSDPFVVIYIGKFGRLYQEDKTFKTIIEQFNSFKMILLSPVDAQSIKDLVLKNNLPIDKLHILSVTKDQVHDYLSAADISIALFKSFESNQYCSPIKIGEYWAAGLFVCIIENESIGSIMEKEESLKLKLRHIKRDDSLNAAKTDRNRGLISSAYNKILSSISEKILVKKTNKIKIVFISYWGINQGLTKSTVLPHIDTLSRNERVKSISLITFERETFITVKSDQFKHIPIDETSSIRGLNKFSSLVQCYKLLKSEKPDLVIARSSLAGIAAYHYHKKTGTPYIVESFEPHADYMIDSGEWKGNGFKTRLLNRYEKNIKKTAAFLLPVAHQYKSKLITEGVAEKKIIVLPCTVDQKQFAFDKTKRDEIRSSLKIDSKVTVGIYVGKFGGLYQEDEAFHTFLEIGQQFESFKMIILSPTEKKLIIKLANQNHFPLDQLHIASVQQQEVPAYLSAADISFATYKSFPSNQYLSPIKIGEYWAAGLFVCMTENVGDDSEIIVKDKIGSIIEKEENIAEKLSVFQKGDAVKAAHKYRSRELIKSAYEIVLSELF